MNFSEVLHGLGYRSVLASAIALSMSSTTFAVDAPSQAWSTTRTHALQRQDVTFSGYASDDKPVSIAVTLKLRNKEVLDEYTKELFQPHGLVYRRFLTQQQAKETFAPTDEQAQAVAAYLKANGFTDVKIAKNNLLVTAKGTVGSARSAFRTTMAEFSSHGIKAIANDTDVQVPAALGQVDQVVGLDTTERMSTKSLPADQMQPAYKVLKSGAHGYYPQEFATVYHAGSTPSGSQTAVAVVGWGNMTPSVSDVRYLIKDKGLPATPVSIISSTETSNDNTGQGEWSMDGQAILGISGGVKSLTYYTSGGDLVFNFFSGKLVSSGAANEALLEVFNRVVSDNTAKVINMSFGENECDSTSPGFANNVFELGVAQGQTFVASSGDNGAYPCGAKGNGTYGDQGKPAVDYPASSPYVVAVGGTTLNTSPNDDYVSETAWPYSGGGISAVEDRPTWQPATLSHRQLPDLAFDADATNSPILMYLSKGDSVDTSGYYGNGGTSLSAPLFVGAWSRLESANGNRLGFAPPAIYAYANNKTAKLPLHDVVAGTNGAYAASSGLDKVTGWGSFDIEAVANFISKTPGFIDASNSGSTSP